VAGICRWDLDLNGRAIWVGPRRPRDRAYRAAYWLAFRVMRAWWFVARPHHRGALVAVWVEDRVLVLRQSYRVHLNLPGGGLGHGETPEFAARRELREEVGLELPPDALRVAWEGESFWDWRRDYVTIFEAHLDAVPDLMPDGREVIEARLIHPLAVLAGPQAPFVEKYLLQRLGQARE
jgi:8-oxo-dGTP pyrophosphatase MutT (NUDIX family)